MTDDRKQTTVRLPQEAYDRLTEELTAFNSDAARFRYLVQFYFDHNDHERGPRPGPECKDPDSNDEQSSSRS